MCQAYKSMPVKTVGNDIQGDVSIVNILLSFLTYLWALVELANAECDDITPVPHPCRSSAHMQCRLADYVGKQAWRENWRRYTHHRSEA